MAFERKSFACVIIFSETVASKLSYFFIESSLSIKIGKILTSLPMIL